MDVKFVVLLLALVAVTQAAPASYSEKTKAQQLHLNRMLLLQEQLGQQQKQFKALEAMDAGQSGSLIADNPMETEASGAVKADVDLHLAEADSRSDNSEATFVKSGMGQEEYIPKPESRQIGWQPIKRRVGWQPMKKAVGWQPFKRDEERTTF